MRTLHSRSPLAAVVGSPEARAIISSLAPELLEMKKVTDFKDLPAGWALTVILGEDDPRVAALLEGITGLPDPRGPLPTAEPIVPDPAYEPQTVARAGARLVLPEHAEANSMVEIVLEGPSHGNPFVDVDLTARFTRGDSTLDVGGFYDGDGRYLVRFLPPVAGTWAFRVTSTARSLDGHEGTIEVQPGDAHGPVRVSDAYHFTHADGTPFAPVGTTAYAWTHQDDALMDRTIATLADAPFNKIRMCVFPKHYLYNTAEPEHFVWVRNEDGSFDPTRFDVEFWHRLEHRLAQLGDLGVQADLILFHPYDRWGFAAQPAAVDDCYLRYLVRRLAAFPHVWWSLANEYDLLTDKTEADWERIAALIGEEDHVGHLLSIHNWVEPWDFASPWATHCSIQRGDQLDHVATWRRRWGKPVLLDEIGYEGDLDQGWGNLTGEELVRRFWEIALRGGYATHGETFWDADDVIWWSKGGVLRGDSPARIAFLERLRQEAPGGRLDPLPSDWDTITGGVAGRYEITYFGANRPRFRDVSLPPGMTALVDVVDTWNMTVTPVPGVHTGALRVDLPARPYVAIRLREADGAPR
ncbi:MAG: DUF5605 domain-containing protein [Arachnia sp.]